MDKQELYDTVNRADQKVEGIWEKYHNPKHIRYRMTRDRFGFIMENVKGPRMLDVGCGVGLAAHLAKNVEGVKEMYGIDLQKAAIEQAKKNSPHAVFIMGYAEDLPFEDNYFDTVIMAETLEHVADVEQCIAEAHRVLRSGGRIIITVPYKGKTSELHVRSFKDKSILTIVKKYFDIEKSGVMDADYFMCHKLYCVGVKDATR